MLVGKRKKGKVPVHAIKESNMMTFCGKYADKWREAWDGEKDDVNCSTCEKILEEKTDGIRGVAECPFRDFFPCSAKDMKKCSECSYCPDKKRSKSDQKLHKRMLVELDDIKHGRNIKHGGRRTYFRFQGKKKGDNQ